MFVFLEMPTLYPDGRLTGFAKATKTSEAAKVYWRRLNSKISLPVLEYFERFFCRYIYIRLITRVSVRYGEIFHEPKASEISRHISQLTSVISDLFL